MWKIVIIDDDRQVIRSMKRMPLWAELGIEVVGDSMNGERGLELILETRPDLVLTDIYMPVMNGLDMIEKLRQAGYGGKIVILSGYSDFQYARQALRLQVDDYLSKPVTVETIREVFAKAAAALEEEREKRRTQDQAQIKLMQYELYYRKEWMTSIVTGASNVQGNEAEISLLPELVRWKHERHAAMVIEIDRTGVPANLSVSDWHLYRFAIQNVIREILQDWWPNSDCMELHGYHTAVILHLEEAATNEIEQRVERMANHMAECVSQYLKLVVRVGFGSFKASWKDLWHSTEEAFRCLNRGNHSPDRDTWQQHTLPHVQKYAQAVTFGNAEQARQVASEFARSLQKENPVRAPHELQALARQMWTLIGYALFESGISVERLGAEAHSAAPIERIANIPAFEEWLSRKTDEIFQAAGMNMTGKHRQAVQSIIQFIHEHYAEELTLADMAERVFISRSYLSHIFKKATGETFNNYVTRVRMEKARRLILDGKYLIYEVAEMVGYRSLPYFSTLFKKYIGVNPGELK